MPPIPTFSFLADIGFALVMFVAGSHVPIRNPALRGGIGRGMVRAALVGVIATALGLGIAAIFDTGHALLYAVLMASSSAALILPIVDSLHLSGPAVLDLLPQVAIADAVCIVALPLVIDPGHALQAAIGAGAVIGCSAVLYLVLRQVERSRPPAPPSPTLRTTKIRAGVAVQPDVLFALAALAVATHVSIMLAGFAFGLVVAAIGDHVG